MSAALPRTESRARRRILHRLSAAAGVAALVVAGGVLPGAEAVSPGTITGTVTTPAGISPSLVSVSANGADGLWLGVAQVSEDGTYRFDDVPDGRWVLYFQAPATDLVPEYYDDAYTFDDATRVTVADGGAARADVELALGSAVAGTVRDEAGEPVEGAQVFANRDDWSGGGGYATTDDEGRYRIGGLRTGGYRVSAGPGPDPSAPYVTGWVGGGTSSQTAPVLQVQAGAPLTGQDVVVPTAAMAAGRLTSADGPVAGGSVRFTSTTDPGNTVWVPTAADGSFLGRMQAGSYRVQFSGPPGSPYAPQYWWRMNIEQSATPIQLSKGATFPLGDVELLTGASVSGTVTDDTGAPVAGVNVSLTTWVGGTGIPTSAVTGTDGRYAVAGLLPGTYRVAFDPPAGSLLVPEYYDDVTSFYDAARVEVPARTAVTGVDAELAVGGALSGRVLGPDGEPIARATVMARPAQQGMSVMSRSVSTDSDGEYRLGGLTAGAWTLEIAGPYGSTWAGEYYRDALGLDDATRVTVVAGEVREVEDVRLEPGATIRGTVLDPDGLPLAGAYVYTLRDGVTASSSARTGADGTFAISGLRAGEYRVAVSPPPGRTDVLNGYLPGGGVAGDSAERVSVSVGGTTTIAPTRLLRGATITGKVTKPDGSPVVGANVSASGPGTYESGLTMADGTYTVGRLAPGSYEVAVSSYAGPEGGYDGLWTLFDGAAGTQRPTKAVPVSVTEAGTRGGVDVVVPPRGDATPEVTMTLDPATPKIGRPVTAHIQVTGAAGPAAGGVAVLWVDDATPRDTVLDAQGRGSLTFDASGGWDEGMLYTWFTGTAAYDEGQGEVAYSPVAPATPVVSSVVPATGSAAGGTVVAITGSNFTTGATVTFGGVPGTQVVVDSPTSMHVTAPMLPAGPAAVVVTTADGSSTEASVFTATPEPTTTSVTASASEVVAGTAVTFTASVSAALGTPSGNVAFSVDGGPTTSVPLTAGSASLTRDDLAPGPHTVTATYAGSTVHVGSVGSGSVVVKPAGPVVTGATPGVLTTEGGTVVVTGSHFSGATEVRFGDEPGTGLTVVSDGRIEVTAPARAAGTVPVVVTTSAGTSAPDVAVQFVDASEGVVSQAPVRAESRPAVSPGAPVCLQVAGTNGVPAGASGVTVNVTTVRPNGPGYVVVYPDTAGDGSTPVPAGSSANFEAGADVANAAFVELPASGRVCYATRGAPSVGVLLDVTGFTMPDAGLVTQATTRLLDTRPAPYRVGDVSGPVLPGAVRTVQVRGRAGVPADATAVIVNATVTNVTGPGNLRIFPAGTPVPNASVLNYAPGKDKANAAIVALSSSGQLSFYSDGSAVDVILDVTGYVTGDAAYEGTAPTRVLDTRPGAGQVGSITGPLRGLQPATFTIPDALVPDGATSVVLNVTAIRPETLGNLRVYPADADGVPNASTINYIPGRDIPNLVVVDLPDAGPAKVALYSDSGGTVNVAVDVAGFVVPAR